jgi:hypothetical protein
MKKLVILLAIMALFAGMAAAKLTVGTPTHELQGPSGTREVFWFDDIEGGVNGWTTADLTATAVPHFHWDAYMAFDGLSWWCGNFDYDADGGYGNSWDDRLVIPTLDLTVATYPILTYAFRHDSETAYDFTYVQAESLGVYTNLNRGYDGTQPWTDIGIYGFILATYDNPFNARFRFLSDGAWSDEDGLYASVGGAFACDNVQVFDYFSGQVFFYDSEPGAREDECVPAVPGAAGDYWHIIDRACPAYSDPHSWWCGDDADTNLVPGGLANSLRTPIISVSAASCTLNMAIHFGIPTIDNDYCEFKAYCNGDYYAMYSYWGDFASCDGWGGTGLGAGYDVGQYCEGEITEVGYEFIMNTTDNGCGPAAGGGGAGIFLDDLTFWGNPWPTPVEDSSWGGIKAMYR